MFKNQMEIVWTLLSSVQYIFMLKSIPKAASCWGKFMEVNRLNILLRISLKQCHTFPEISQLTFSVLGIRKINEILDFPHSFKSLCSEEQKLK